MIPINKDLQAKINLLATPEGSKALEELANALLEYYSTECMQSEGNAVYRNQGAAQLAKWLKTLPKGLRDNVSTNTYS
jgi:hypothetical protein